MENKNELFQAQIEKDKLLYIRIEDFKTRTGTNIPYGTSGFRFYAELMEPIALRSGIFCCMLSKYYHPSVLGVVITASHNIVNDNGLKMIGEDGGMLHRDLECLAENQINTKDLLEAIINLSKDFENYHSKKNQGQKERGTVFLGNDTRPSAQPIKELFKLGANTVCPNVVVYDWNLMTTPIVHHHVKHYNDILKNEIDYDMPQLNDIYYKKLGQNFQKIQELTKDNLTKNSNNSIILDCANGIGTEMTNILFDNYIKNSVKHMTIINNNMNDTANLNKQCGAEFVQKIKEVPMNFEKAWRDVFQATQIKAWGTSFDGDADRIVFFTYDSDQNNKKFSLIDGDRLSVQYANVIGHFLPSLNELLSNSNPEFVPYKVGVVHTAYANSGAIRYIKNNLGITVKCAPTGVKFSHPEALKFDIGIYFESNGHGTICFKEKLQNDLKNILETQQQTLSVDIYQKLTLFKTFQDLINTAVGDALANLLMVLSSLNILDMTLEDLLQKYEDLPSSTTKCKVTNKYVIKTSYDEQTVVEPSGQQNSVDDIVKDYELSRCFVRPSGTEDVVRIYAEAQTESLLQELVERVTKVCLENPVINS